MQNFQKVYGELNTKQREAVDQIEGPVMVLAGPGTGKTQLLGARVANILNLTDVNPGNILCLTYTEAGVSAMRSRLASLIGSAGYQVSVQTFHSFALEVFRRFPDYFLDYRGFQPVDDLSRYEVIKKILQGLPPSFKLAHRSFGRNDSIKDLVSKIAELKKAGLTPKETMEIADQNFQDLEDLKELLDLVPNPLPKKKTEQLQLQEILANYLSSQNYPAELNSSVVISNLKSIVLNSLAAALLEAQELQKNTPITAWKGATLEKTSSGNWKFKDLEFNQNLQEVTYVYEVYSKKLIELEKLEFEDMILNLINGLRHNSELKYNVQEQWQYILVDEFQDTSFAQLEIIRLLGENPASEGAPNIMAVGDDDQAIYAFQGAEVSNIQTFVNFYPKKVNLITLQDNYRSSQEILSSSLETAKFIQERPTGTVPKELVKKSRKSLSLKVELQTLPTQDAELSWLAQDIKTQIKNGTKAEEIAVLAPKHKFLIDLSAELAENQIPVYYQSSSNILEDEVVLNLINLAELVLQISKGVTVDSKAKLAEVLTDPYWGLPSSTIWNLSLTANKINQEKNPADRKHWLELMQEGLASKDTAEDIELQTIANLLLSWGADALNLSLEKMLDLLVGVTKQDQPTSPFKKYYFSQAELQKNPAKYATFLSSLSTLREHLRNYYPDLENRKLQDLVDYVRLCQEYGGLKIAKKGVHLGSGGVNLITAYGSKGLEFEQVYIMHSVDKVWSEAASSNSQSLKFTSNFKSHKDTSDDKTRLFYVAQTRAKNRLVHSSYKFDNKGKEVVPLRYLEPLKDNPEIKLNFKDCSGDLMSTEQASEAYEQKLFSNLNLTGTKASLAEVLAPILEEYRLSATHLGTLFDEDYGGELEFINRHLLRFPQAMNDSAVHGSAIHRALEKAHLAFNKNSQIFKDLNLTDFLLESYQKEITKSSLDVEIKIRLLEKTKHTFTKLQKDLLNLIQLNVKPEVDIKVNFDEARLSGKIDAVIINKEQGTATIRDYKTGTPKKSLDSRYKNQLYFYRLLLEISPQILPKNIKLKSAELAYISPKEDQLIIASLDYHSTKNESEYLEFKKLVKDVWSQIMSLGQS